MNKRALKNYKKNKAIQQATRRVYEESVCSKDPEVYYSDNEGPGLPLEPLEPVEPKGMPGGRCNVTACQRENSAIFLNLGQIGRKHPDTGGCYYCVDCATDIHRANQPYSEAEGMTLFPEYDAMMSRYREIWKARDGRDTDDIANYTDIEQNPWGSCYHWDRDKFIENNRNPETI